MPLFAEIIARVDGFAKCKVILLSSNNSMIDKTCRARYFNEKALQYIELSLVRRSGNGTKNNIAYLFGLIKNFFSIYKLVGLEKPEMVIVGSDAGNVNIRFLLGLCSHYSIPVLILYNTDFRGPTHIAKINYLLNTLLAKLDRFKFFVFIRAMIYKCEIPGLFVKNSSICVIHRGIKEKLARLGIGEERIFVMGLEGETSVASLSNFHLKHTLCGNRETKLVVVFTECLRDLYGSDYTAGLYRTFLDEFSKLPPAIRVVVKLHPRENSDEINLIKNTFKDSGVLIIEDIDVNVNDLISISDLVIAHFSKVLITASLMNKKILSINWKNDREKTFLNEEEGSLLEIKSPQELLNKINDALYSADFNDQAAELIQGIADRYKGSPEDMNRLVQLILKQIGRDKNDVYPGYVPDNH